MVPRMIERTYTDLSRLTTYADRFDYLMLKGLVGKNTFGFDRYLNQQFYRSEEWRRIRDLVILRDNACDLGLPGYEIFGTIHIHHMNPILPGDIINASDYLLNIDYLICVSPETHNAIHYGSKNYVDSKDFVVRFKNDHCPWRK